MFLCFYLLFFFPKKTFEPNVHAVRKSKDEWVTISKITQVSCLIMKAVHIMCCHDHKHVGFFSRLKEDIHVAPKKERRERRREIRGRRRERPQTIQSHSIFEQGPADTIRKTGALFSLTSFVSQWKLSTHDTGLVTDALQAHFFHPNQPVSLFRLAWCYRPAGLHLLSCV